MSEPESTSGLTRDLRLVARFLAAAGAVLLTTYVGIKLHINLPATGFSYFLIVVLAAMKLGFWEATVALRPELRYERGFDNPAYNAGAKKSQFMFAADVIWFF